MKSIVANKIGFAIGDDLTLKDKACDSNTNCIKVVVTVSND